VGGKKKVILHPAEEQGFLNFGSGFHSANLKREKHKKRGKESTPYGGVHLGMVERSHLLRKKRGGERPW